MDPLERLRAICLNLPETSERRNHGSPAFVVRSKSFAIFLAAGRHGPGSDLWCPAPEGVQAEVVAAEPERFFVPPYVGRGGWIGVHLDIDPDWDEIRAIIHDAYRKVAPKRLSVGLNPPATTAPPTHA
ncbi:MmcQ/YjbR family DNA-binding protein [Nocardia paucivorans]|uniref:MmcQ/YjbR family DNA-binding protein n=1 Tax=Nocardia paucivorans TaxID=114259 RepID=UPI00031BA3A9|nr:MmcQ/YjbR family DNA-binding protein [Nocardia paucivorans]